MAENGVAGRTGFRRPPIAPTCRLGVARVTKSWRAVARTYGYALRYTTAGLWRSPFRQTYKGYGNGGTFGRSAFTTAAFFLIARATGGRRQ